MLHGTSLLVFVFLLIINISNHSYYVAKKLHGAAFLLEKQTDSQVSFACWASINLIVVPCILYEFINYYQQFAYNALNSFVLSFTDMLQHTLP